MQANEDAFNAIVDEMHSQVEQAIATGAECNVDVTGDALVRKRAQTVLNRRDLRRTFLLLAADRRAWPRLRSLFGSPPYYFLQQGDEWSLRAAGMARGRVRMVYDAGANFASLDVPNYAQFGTPHATDDVGRQYRVVLDQPWIDGFDDALEKLASLGTTKSMLLDTRLPKYKRRENGQTPLKFTLPGERIILKSKHWKDGGTVVLRALKLQVRDNKSKSATGRLLCTGI